MFHRGLTAGRRVKAVSPGGLPTLSLTTNSSWLPWGRVALPLVSPWECRTLNGIFFDLRKCKKMANCCRQQHCANNDGDSTHRHKVLIRRGHKCRGVYPPNTLEQVPLPFPLLSLPSLPIEVAPLIVARGLGERFSSPSGSGQSPAAKLYLVNFRLKISPLVATIFRSFSGNETSNYDRHVGCREINHSVFAET